MAQNGNLVADRRSQQGHGQGHYTYLVDIGDQAPCLGHAPEFEDKAYGLVDVRWLALDEIAERDRAFLWSAGLLAVEAFLAQVEERGDAISIPGRPEGDR